MKYRRVEIETLEAWKINKADVENHNYPDFIKDAVTRGDIKFHNSMSEKEKDLVLVFVLCNDGVSHCCGTGDYITFDYSNGFRIMQAKYFESHFAVVEENNDGIIIEEKHQNKRITVLPTGKHS